MATRLDPQEMIARVNSQRIAAKDALSPEEMKKAALMEVLAKIGGLSTKDDDVQFRGTEVVIPEQYKGNLRGYREFLKRYEDSQETHYTFVQTFRNRPLDGANAFNNTLINLFGNAGIGKVTPGGMFSPDRPPQLRTIETGVDTTTQVPWGEVEMPLLEATFTLAMVDDREYGYLFTLAVDAPRKNKAHIQAVFDAITKELQVNSIYKGKAITGSDEPGFIDVNTVDPKTVVYSDEVLTQLDANFWSLLKYTDEMRANKVPLKRAILLEGPYGTGKSLAGMLTAQQAVANGWTFINVRPGQDNLFRALKTAVVYAPAVVWFEDIDTLAANQNASSDMDISRLLDALDGITNKNGEVVAAFTTNHVDKLQKGVLRPGRLDAIIHIGELDRTGMEKLVRSVVQADKLDSGVDFDTVYESFKDFYPAFAKEAIDRAKRFSMNENRGRLAPLTTQNFVDAAHSLTPQLKLMNKAEEGVRAVTFSDLIKADVAKVVDNTYFADTTAKEVVNPRNDAHYRTLVKKDTIDADQDRD
jgi:hypothetical protein